MIKILLTQRGVKYSLTATTVLKQVCDAIEAGRIFEGLGEKPFTNTISVDSRASMGPYDVDILFEVVVGKTTPLGTAAERIGTIIEETCREFKVSCQVVIERYAMSEDIILLNSEATTAST
ncbi:MAG: hypothetical protein IT410_01640 [Candidatus Doudnabacteria bacterium]|nr:hypothetical protein [Candidatus Doudnabacteria bacterium]